MSKKGNPFSNVRFLNQDAVPVDPLPGELIRTRSACPQCGHRHVEGFYSKTCTCGSMATCADCYLCCRCKFPMRKQVSIAEHLALETQETAAAHDA